MAMNEARLRIKTLGTKTTVFSTQDIVECSEYSQGCNGGFPYLISGKYSEDFGIVEESCKIFHAKQIARVSEVIQLIIIMLVVFMALVMKL